MHFSQINWRSLLLLLLLSPLGACQPNQSSSSKESAKEVPGVLEQSAHENHEESVTLTKIQMETVGIDLGYIEMKELTNVLQATGFLKVPNNNKAKATSMFGGVLKSMPVHIGDYVQKGQVVATVANPQFISLQEEYLSVKSQLIFAEEEMQRQEVLQAGKAGALKNLQEARSHLNSLKTRQASLYRQLQLMGISPQRLTNDRMQSTIRVLSPISGVVSEVYGKIGAYVDVSSPVIEIVDHQSLHLDLQVYERDLPLLKPGQIIHFTLTNNPVKEYDAKIFSIGSSFEKESKTILVHCEVIGDKRNLIDGMNVTALISLSNQTAPAVPNSAIVTEEDKDYIFVVTQEKKDEKDTHYTFEKRQILKQLSYLGYTAITPVKEISPGVKIVAKGAFFIHAKMVNTGGHDH